MDNASVSLRPVAQFTERPEPRGSNIVKVKKKKKAKRMKTQNQQGEVNEGQEGKGGGMGRCLGFFSSVPGCAEAE